MNVQRKQRKVRVLYRQINKEMLLSLRGVMRKSGEGLMLEYAREMWSFKISCLGNTKGWESFSTVTAFLEPRAQIKLKVVRHLA